MGLNEFLDRKGAGAAAQLARAIGVTQAVISQWRKNVRPIPADRCPDIERATDGEVRCEDLRSDVDWATVRRGIGAKNLQPRATAA